jgi:hypothetical protein
LYRLRQQATATGDAVLADLFQELVGLGDGGPQEDHPGAALDGIAVPLELDTAKGRLSLISTTTVFGTPTEVTLSELAIEAFFPANAVTTERLRALREG